MPRIETLMGLARSAGHMPLPPRTRSSVSYNGASMSRRASHWSPGADGLTSLLFSNGDILRRRSRDIVRQNPWAANGVEKWVANAIGAGIKPQSKHADAATKKQIQAAWLRWTDESDADGLTDFYGQQALIYREMIEAGEVFIRLRPRRPVDGLSVPLQLQILEAEHVPYYAQWKDVPEGHKVHGGIEVNRIGKRVAYHMFRHHPGDSTVHGGDSSKMIRVPAEQVIHVFRPMRTQMRGEPWLAKVLMRLYNLDRYEDAELEKQKIAAMFAFFIEQNTDGEVVLPRDSSETGDVDGSERGISGLEPGTGQVLLPGQKVTFSDPPQNGNHESVMRSGLRGAAAGLGNTYEHVSGDASQLNFSSIRAMLVEFRLVCEQIQHSVIVFQLCRPIWKAWMDQAVLSGALKLPGYERDPYPHQNVEWRPPRRPWVDPYKDILAVKEEIRAGLKPRSMALNELGYDEEEIDEMYRRDNERADAAGLVFDTDTRQSAASAAPPEEDDEETRERKQQEGKAA